MERIWKVGFITSGTAYLAFWMMDAVRPGFVARAFSVHLFLLGAIVFGALWLRGLRSYRSHRALQYVFAGLLAILLAVITWLLAEPLVEFRSFLTLLSFFVPGLVLFLLRTEN